MTLMAHETVDVGPSHPNGPTHSIIWLHGLGADGHDFEPIVGELGLPPELSARFIFPHADVRPVTLNGGMPMRAWYDIISLEGARDGDMEGVRNSCAQVEALMTAEKDRGVPAQQIVLAGFSQGGAIALHLGLRYPERLAGILALSTYLLSSDGLGPEHASANAKTPIFQCHGSYDPVVVLPMGEHCHQTLTAKGYDIDWRTYPMAHQVHPQEILDVGAWLTQRLGGS